MSWPVSHRREQLTRLYLARAPFRVIAEEYGGTAQGVRSTVRKMRERGELPPRFNPKRMTDDLAERVVEDICEEAHEDAENQVEGLAELKAAFEAALEAFNNAQTSCSWMPRPKEVFRIPASGTEAGTGETEGLDPKGDGPTSQSEETPNA